MEPSINSFIKRISYRGKITFFVIFLLFIVVALFFLQYLFHQSNEYPDREYVAHAGGDIDGYSYTNSVEAVENSLQLGINYVELDLNLTIDDQLVAVHDWPMFHRITGRNETTDVDSLSVFKKQKIYGRYTPITHNDIIRFFRQYPSFHLVTDIICNDSIIDHYFSEYKDRIFIECFSYEECMALKRKGYRPMFYATINNEVMIKERILSLFTGDPYPDAFTQGVDEYIQTAEKCKSLPWLARIQNAPYAIYTCKDRKEADKLFSLYPNVKFIYINDVRK